METAIYDLKINQYSDYTKIFTMYDENNALVDLTTYTPITLGIQVSQSNSSSILSLSLTSGLTTTSTGTLTINIASSTTSTLTSNKYWYYLEMTNADSKKDRYMQGDVYINLR
jgi:uncharacterized membrane protein